jgi:hypothetical protein
MGGEQSIIRLDSLVDFLLDRPTKGNEPRRFLPQNPWAGRPRGVYTIPDVFDKYDYIKSLMRHGKLEE